MNVSVEKIFPITSEDISAVRAVYNKHEDDIRRDIEIIKSWLKKQPHLPQEHDDERLERFLLRNKFRVEQTKIKLDNYFTLRARHLDFFEDLLNPDSPAFSNIADSVIIAPMPRLTERKERVTVMKCTGENLEEYNFKDNMMLLVLMVDLQLTCDYTVGDIIVYDFQDFKLSNLKTFTPTAVSDTTKLHQEGFSGRLTGVHYINAPSFINLIFNIFKQALSKKLYDKLHIHDSMESLYKVVPKECLPVEYGGPQRSIVDVYADFRDLIVKEGNFLRMHASRYSNEKLRIGKVAENEQFGVEGTFKTIRLD